jgi:hypothetical protein
MRVHTAPDGAPGHFRNLPMSNSYETPKDITWKCFWQDVLSKFGTTLVVNRAGSIPDSLREYYPDLEFKLYHITCNGSPDGPYWAEADSVLIQERNLATGGKVLFCQERLSKRPRKDPRPGASA